MPLYAVLAAIFVTMCWGGNFSAMHLTMIEIPPFLALTLRFAAVSLLLAPFALRYKVPSMRDMLFVSMTLIVLQFALVFSAMHMGLSITSVIIAVQLGVPFACVMAAIFFKDYLGPWRSAGLMVAFLGVLVVAGTPNASEHWVGFLVTIMGAFCWSAANIYMKRMAPVKVVVMIFWPALLAVPPLALLSAVVEENQWEILRTAHLTSWMGIAYGTVFSSIIGYGLWSWLIKRYPMSQVVPYSLLVPVVGISAGAWMFGEPITARIMVGAVLTIFGVGIISLRRPQLVEAEQ